MNDLALYRWLVVCRVLDQALCAENPRWFPIEGEEATVVGSFLDLRPDDAVAPHYRDPFVVYLMRGAEMWRLAAQVLGKAAGYNKGRSVPFNGPVELNVVPWVAGDLGTTLGVAAGAALAFQDEGSDRVCVCTFGDGTANRGDLHEALNLAACWRLPIVYVCQHNGWAISQASATYLRAPVVDRAAGYGIPGVAVDGNDVEAVRVALREAVALARDGGGPTLIEARTWRWRGHWAGDAQTYRGGPEPAHVEDPLDLFAYRLLERGTSLTELQRVDAEVADEVRAAIERAQSAPAAGAAELGLDEVYAPAPPSGAERTPAPRSGPEQRPAPRSGPERGPVPGSGGERGPAPRSGAEQRPAPRSGAEGGPAPRSGSERESAPGGGAERGPAPRSGAERGPAPGSGAERG